MPEYVSNGRETVLKSVWEARQAKLEETKKKIFKPIVVEKVKVVKPVVVEVKKTEATISKKKK